MRMRLPKAFTGSGSQWQGDSDNGSDSTAISEVLQAESVVRDATKAISRDGSGSIQQSVQFDSRLAG
jgi:hypothetical protein